MSSGAFVATLTLIALGATLVKGWRWAFVRLFLPSLLLVPCPLLLEFRGLPNLTPQRGVALGMLIGCLVLRRERDLLPRWRALDAWVLALLLSYSVSFGVNTDLKGFAHQIAVLTLDWGLPYLFARRLFVDGRHLRPFLAVVAACGFLLAFFSLYEARMADRLAARMWDAIAGYPVPDFWRNGGGMRYGFLRAFGPFVHPLVLASVLVALTPLILAWGYVDRGKRALARLAAAATAVGVLGPIARGPALVLGGLGGLTSMIVLRLPVVLLTACGGLLGYLLLSDTAQDVLVTTQIDLDVEGNTESGKYRLALLLIYLKEIPKVGWFGDPSVIGASYQAAWSIDNGYLFMYLTGGWIGGTGFLLLVLATCVAAYRALGRSRGLERRVRACVAASFLGLALCVANVWFARDLHPLFFVLLALVWSQRAPGWYRLAGAQAASTGGSPRARRSPSRPRSLQTSGPPEHRADPG